MRALHGALKRPLPPFRQLQEHARELDEATTHTVRPRWMTYGDDAEALQDFINKTTKAITLYHVGPAARGRRLNVSDIFINPEACSRKPHRGTRISHR